MNARRAARAVARALPFGSALVAVLLAATPAGGQIPGENVNMVSGTEWPGGDPFLQRQNEPSIAVSTANPRHLLAGANDYRTVDLPNPVADPLNQKFAADAWLGVFKSFDGGQTWQSVLLPGYAQDTSAEGLASPLRGYQAAADPVVRAAPGGLFYFSGITFNRGSNLGQVFVARYLDRNDKENGDATLARDPIQYLDVKVVDAGTSGRFLDKPWTAVDIRRSGTATCTLPTSPPRTVPAGTLYIAYSMFPGSNASTSEILFTRSTDCGRTWDTPQKLSESNTLNQGAVLAVDPASGAVQVAWRRFQTTSRGDAIVTARSVDFGRTFTKPSVVVDIPGLAFDQPASGTRFRIEALPTLAISLDGAGTSRIHLAWSQRAANADGRIVMTTSADGLTWPAPVEVDAAPINDDPPGPAGTPNSFTRGHQFMPQLTFTQGRLMLVFYDSRLNHTRAYYRPNQPFEADLLGRFYAELRGPLGELRTSPGLVYTPFIDDAGLTEARHTVDVRVAEAFPAATPSFSSVQLSQYRFGTRGDETPNQQVAGFQGPLQVTDADEVLLLQQLQSNPPNLPIFKQGTRPFLGDYIDIAGPAFVPTSGGGWAFNTAHSPAPVHYAVWTTNQDVRPPPTGKTWADYTPIGGGGQSLFDPTQVSPQCVTGLEGMRNQNIYSARITSGLIVTSPQNAKPLSDSVPRGFVVLVQNESPYTKAVRISASPPAGVYASFRNDGIFRLDDAGQPIPGELQAFDVAIPPRSSITRTLFANLRTPAASPASTIPVRVDEVDAGGGSCLGAIPPTCPITAGGLSGFLTLNPPGSTPFLTQPDGSPVPITSIEIYPPSIGAANVTSANVTSANVTSANVTSANVTSANVTSANVTSTHISNPDLANVTSANVTSANVTSANVTSANVTSAPLAANVTSANVTSANVTSASISDANYTVTNTGNSTHSYRVQIVGSAPAGTALQLIISKPSYSPIGLGCQLLLEPRPIVIANVDDVSGALVPPGGNLADPNIPDPRTTNATLSLAPGETAQITLRGVLDTSEMAALTSRLTPAVVPHAGGSYAAPLLVTSDGTALPVPQVGVPYAASLAAIGGTPPYAWSVAAGSLPAGLTLDAGGQLAGTPASAATATFTVQVQDSAGTPGTATRSVTLTVQPGPTTVRLEASSAAPVYGQAITLAATVSPNTSAVGVPAPSGTATFRDHGTVVGTGVLGDGTALLGLPSLATGSHVFTALYPGDSNYQGSASAGLTVTVGKASTSTVLASSATPSAFGQPVTLSVTVGAVAPGAGMPLGSVVFRDGESVLGTEALSGGAATLTVSSLAVGAHAVSASYGGDGSFVGSASAFLSQEVVPAATALALAVSPDAPVFGQPVTLAAAVSVLSPGAGVPTGLVTFRDGGTDLGTVALCGGGASLTLASVGAGSHAFSATYGGDGRFGASTANPVPTSVGKAPTSTGLATSPNPSVSGQAVTLTATVATAVPGAGTPSGTVRFLDGAALLGTATLAQGAASLTTAALAPGPHAIYAEYQGDTSFGTSTSPVRSQTVNLGGSATALAASPTTSVVGQAVTLTATVSPTSPATGSPTGTVTFRDGTTVLGTATLSSGVATLEVSSLQAGVRSLTATYGGDGRFAGSASGAVGVTVQALYAFTGFLAPLRTAGTYASPTYSGTQKFGSAIPIKWQLRDASGALVTRLSSTRLLEALPNPACTGAPPAGSAPLILYSPTNGATGGSTFRIGTDTFIFNWDTSSGVAKGCYNLVVSLDDGTKKSTIVKLQ